MAIGKKYVNVLAEFSAEGELKPRYILWDDGRRFEVDKVKDCRRAASLKAGGSGLRFTCIIRGGEHFLFYEENYKWFVELKD
ncbi:MAG: hypothetical protein HUJ69_09900 [Lachnospiraceae bacterium]|nr:hypothetical protein [Lachnospiraceae bacterium]